MTAGGASLSGVAYRVALPLRRSFDAAHGRTHRRDVIVVSVSSERATGWGECPTLDTGGYVGGTTAEAWHWFRSLTAPVDSSRAGAPLPLMAVAAVRDAHRDHHLRVAGRSAAGDNPSSSLACTQVLGISPTIDRLLAHATEAIDRGVVHLKAKVTPSWCSEPVAALRRSWPQASIAVDANGSFDGGDRDHVRALDSLADLGLAYVEQPFTPLGWRTHHGSWSGAVPVALDEGILALDDVHWVIRHRAASLVNLKPARVGGAAVCHAMAGMLADAGIGVFVGGMLETGVGRATALAVAAACCPQQPTDLGPSAAYFEQDLTDPIVAMPGGRVEVPQGPGIARAPRSEQLDAVVLDTVTLHASALAALTFEAPRG